MLQAHFVLVEVGEPFVPTIHPFDVESDGGRVIDGIAQRQGLGRCPGGIIDDGEDDNFRRGNMQDLGAWIHAIVVDLPQLHRRPLGRMVAVEGHGRVLVGEETHGVEGGCEWLGSFIAPGSCQGCADVMFLGKDVSMKNHGCI